MKPQKSKELIATLSASVDQIREAYTRRPEGFSVGFRSANGGPYDGPYSVSVSVRNGRITARIYRDDPIPYVPSPAPGVGK